MRKDLEGSSSSDDNNTYYYYHSYVPAFIAFSSRDEAQAAKDAMESGPCTFGGAMMRETVLR